MGASVQLLSPLAALALRKGGLFCLPVVLVAMQCSFG